MFLKLTAGGELLFEDRQNFRAFKLVVEADRVAACRSPRSARRQGDPARCGHRLDLPGDTTPLARRRARRQMATELCRHDREGTAARLDQRRGHDHQGACRVGDVLSACTKAGTGFFARGYRWRVGPRRMAPMKVSATAKVLIALVTVLIRQT